MALGGNALLRRGQPMTAANQRENVKLACDRLAPIAGQHELIISHGNGPQIGLLALEEAAYGEVPASPLDVLGAETQGMIGLLGSANAGSAGSTSIIVSSDASGLENGSRLPSSCSMR